MFKKNDHKPDEGQIFKSEKICVVIIPTSLNGLVDAIVSVDL